MEATYTMTCQFSSIGASWL